MTTWDDKPNDYEHALAVIFRLRVELAEFRDACADELLRQRSTTIEECARVVENMRPATIPPYYTTASIATAIRALKGKT